MRYRVLGPLAVTDGAEPVPVSGAKIRTLLGSLLLHANQQVSLAFLSDRLWGDERPLAPRRVVQTNIVRLRQALPWPDSIITGAGGYLARVEEDQLDLLVFRRLLAQAGATGDLETEAAHLEAALNLWRGPACAGIDSPRLLDLDAATVDELRLQALDRRIEIDLLLGRGGGLIPELRRLTTEHPLREGFWLRLMAALHQQGRRGEALEAYHAISHRLVGALGIEPGAELREVHRQIFDGRGDHRLLFPSPAGTSTAALRPKPPRRELPPAVAPFIGRVDELALLDKAGHDGAVIVIDGPAGAGKTGLASHWCHSAAGSFPGGQIYLDLHGFDDCPPSTRQAASAALLAAVGVPASELPQDAEARSALLRSVTSDRRMLILLDNARDAAQVRPLLPGPTCTTVITSRNQLRELVVRHGARRISLRGLDPDESVAVLASIAGEARIHRHREQAHRLAQLCDHTPLGLRILAERLLRLPSLTPHGLLERLVDERARLDTLAVEADGLADMRTVLSWSFDALDAETIRVLHILAVKAAAGMITPASVAAATAMTRRDSRRHLDRLAAVHLLEQHDDDRYRMGGLVRAYILEQYPRRQSAAPFPMAMFPLQGLPVSPADFRQALTTHRRTPTHACASGRFVTG